MLAPAPSTTTIFQSLTAAQKKDLGAPFDTELKTKDGIGSYQQFDGCVLTKTGDADATVATR